MAIEYSGYSSGSIHKATGAQRHRLDAGQFLDAVNVRGIENQLFELMDNSIDESLEYYKVLSTSKRFKIMYNGKKMSLRKVLKLNNEVIPPLELDVEIREDNHVIISDMGRGLPCDIPVDKNGTPTGEEPGIFPIYEDDSAGSKKVHSKANLKDKGILLDEEEEIKNEDVDEEDDDEGDGDDIDEAYSGTDISGMHGAGGSVAKSITNIFKVVTRTLSRNAIGEGAGQYAVSYTNGERDRDKGENGLVYLGELEYDNPNPILAKYNIPRTGTTIEYVYAEDVLTAEDDEGRPCDPYDKDSIIERLRTSLIGVANRNAIVINFTFKGETVRISPNDYTPEIILGVDSDSDNLCQIELESPPTALPKDQFKARLFLNYMPEKEGFHITNVVNRLPLTYSTATKVIERCILNSTASTIARWHSKNPKIKKPPERQGGCAKYFQGVLIMHMPLPIFSSQTKDTLTSSSYLKDFSIALEKIFADNPEIFDAAIERYKEYAETYTRIQQNEEDLKKQREKELKNKKEKKTEEQIFKEAKSKQGDMREQIKAEKKDKSFIPCRHSEKCPVAFFEGRTAVEPVMSAIGSGKVSVNLYQLKGKLPNVFDPKFSLQKSEKVLNLVNNVFVRDFPEYYIFTDPDPDGAHIAILLLAIISKYKPEMLVREKVFIIRAPYGKVFVPQDKVVSIKNDYEGVRKLKPGMHNFVNSYGEMASALAQGALFKEAYAGVSAVVSSCIKDGITVHELLTNPQYKVPIKSPKKDELSYLQNMLTPNSIIKKQFTNQYFTNRQRECKFVTRGYKDLKVKKGAGKMLEEITQSISDTPTVRNYQALEFYNL